MLVIGSLHTHEDKGYRQLRGEIQTLELDLSFWLESKRAASSENAPAYAILCKSRTGRTVQVGSAWKKTIKAQRRAGEGFLSLTFDDPSSPRRSTSPPSRRTNQASGRSPGAGARTGSRPTPTTLEAVGGSLYHPPPRIQRRRSA